MNNPLEFIAYQISQASRNKKWRQFLTLMKPQSGERILDVGVNVIEYSESDNYLERHYAYPECITAVAIENNTVAFQERYPQVEVVSADAAAHLPFSVNEFDIAYSNAVIEHVGNRERQIVFLRELYRVTKRGYITTPNRLFPIEVHTRIPLLHLFLPKAGFNWIATKIGKGWAAGNYMNLLSPKELSLCAETAGIQNFQILKNRFLGFSMTLTLIWTKPT